MGATLDRRDFLKVGAAAGGGLLLWVALPGGGRRGAVAAADREDALLGAGLQPSAFLRVDPDGSVTIWVGKADMGQGVRTALPMIVADELDADWSRVTSVQADAHPEKYGRQMTVGSSSVRGGAWTPLRQAGAAAREMLVAAAAARWGVPAAGCRTERGRVLHDASGRSLGYGELAAEAAALDVPAEPRLKDPSEFTLIGTRVPLVDTRDKVTGRAGYGIDARAPGMLYATVLRPPVFGASLGSFDATRALAVEGVRDVLEISAGVAVVADHTWAAFEGAKALDVTWEPGGFAMGSEEIARRHAELARGPAAVAREEGDPDGALEATARRVDATYEVPYLAHATMEPMNCTAHARGDGCEVWAPTQTPQRAQRVAAELTGLPLEDVTVHVTYLGCGWGRRHTDFVEDAVETSMKAGAPVQVVWTREEDMRHDQYRPASRIDFAGGLDDAGRAIALRARVTGQPLLVPPGGGGRAGRERGADRNAVEGVASMGYAIPNLRVDYCRSDVGVPTGYWRSVGPSGNTFMVEGFVDELAHAAGRDPLEFRLELLRDHPRLTRVLELAAEKAGWDSPPPEGRARGIGLVEDKGGHVAQIAELSVEDGGVRVHRVTCAVDCGQVVHPGIVEAQTVGSVVAGLTAALYGEITLDGGRVVQSNFHDYGMLRMREMPDVEVHIVDSRDEPGGVGEPAVPPIAPAVANALFALTGTRIRSLPIRL